MNRKAAVLLGAVVLLIAANAWAHHNMSAIFDFNDRITITGTLTKVDWRNPHIYVFVDAKTADQVHNWSIEGPPPGFFRTRDASAKDDFEKAIGKSVTAEASRARDGSRAGLMRTITLPGGKVVSACPQNC